MNNNNINNWLDSDSRLYSIIMEEPITRRTVILVNLIMALLLMCAIIGVEYPLITLILMCCAWILVKRIKRIKR